jgi:hypothetical protein
MFTLPRTTEPEGLGCFTTTDQVSDNELSEWINQILRLPIADGEVSKIDTTFHGMNKGR